MRAIARHAPVQQKSRISNDGMLKRVTTTFRTSRGGKVRSTRWVPATPADCLRERVRRMVMGEV